jgi:Kdo2-lipid IVA lauroyltransferase/acyltransferase
MPERSKGADPPRHSAAHRVEYALARTLEAAVSALPERAADGVGRRIGRAVHRLGIRRKVVEENLRLAFPEQPAEWIHRTSIAAYEHLGREAAAILRLSKLDRQAIVDRTVPVGWDDLEAALAQGKGLMLVTGHYGNWEIAAATVASRGVPIAAIVRRQGNRLVDERLNGLRARLGVEVITQREAPSRVPRLLRKNAVIGIVGDQDARRAGVFVPFFGRPASTHRGPAVFALKLGAPVFACVARRLPGAAVRYEVSGGPVPVERTGDLEADVTALTARLAAALEAEVRKAPEQYFWFHRRWKSKPKSEPDGRGAGIPGAGGGEQDDAEQDDL